MKDCRESNSFTRTGMCKQQEKYMIERGQRTHMPSYSVESVHYIPLSDFLEPKQSRYNTKGNFDLIPQEITTTYISPFYSKKRILVSKRSDNDLEKKFCDSPMKIDTNTTNRKGNIHEESAQNTTTLSKSPPIINEENNRRGSQMLIQNKDSSEINKDSIIHKERQWVCKGNEISVDSKQSKEIRGGIYHLKLNNDYSPQLRDQRRQDEIIQRDIDLGKDSKMIQTKEINENKDEDKLDSNDNNKQEKQTMLFKEMNKQSKTYQFSSALTPQVVSNVTFDSKLQKENDRDYLHSTVIKDNNNLATNSKSSSFVNRIEDRLKLLHTQSNLTFGNKSKNSHSNIYRNTTNEKVDFIHTNKTVHSFKPQVSFTDNILNKKTNSHTNSMKLLTPFYSPLSNANQSTYTKDTFNTILNQNIHNIPNNRLNVSPQQKSKKYNEIIYKPQYHSSRIIRRNYSIDNYQGDNNLNFNYQSSFNDNKIKKHNATNSNMLSPSELDYNYRIETINKKDDIQNNKSNYKEINKQNDYENKEKQKILDHYTFNNIETNFNYDVIDDENNEDEGLYTLQIPYFLLVKSNTLRKGKYNNNIPSTGLFRKSFCHKAKTTSNGKYLLENINHSRCIMNNSKDFLGSFTEYIPQKLITTSSNQNSYYNNNKNNENRNTRLDRSQSLSININSNNINTNCRSLSIKDVKLNYDYDKVFNTYTNKQLTYELNKSNIKNLSFAGVNGNAYINTSYNKQQLQSNSTTVNFCDLSQTMSRNTKESQNSFKASKPISLTPSASIKKMF